MSWLPLPLLLQAKVLLKWEAYNQEQRGAGKEPAVVSPAAVALRSWGRVGRKARLALQKASAASVLQLEGLLLDYLEKVWSSSSQCMSACPCHAAGHNHCSP